MELHVIRPRIAHVSLQACTSESLFHGEGQDPIQCYEVRKVVSGVSLLDRIGI